MKLLTFHKLPPPTHIKFSSFRRLLGDSTWQFREGVVNGPEQAVREELGNTEPERSQNIPQIRSFPETLALGFGDRDRDRGEMHKCTLTSIPGQLRSGVQPRTARLSDSRLRAFSLLLTSTEPLSPRARWLPSLLLLPKHHKGDNNWLFFCPVFIYSKVHSMWSFL